MTMKPPPPGPATHGTVTPMALAVATAASTALPPRLSTLMPAALAFTSIDATAPPVPTATGVFGYPGPSPHAPDGKTTQQAAHAATATVANTRRLIGPPPSP